MTTSNISRSPSETQLTFFTLGGLLIWFGLMARHVLFRWDRGYLKGVAIFYDWKQDGKADKRSLDATELWDNLQTSLNCCGINSAYDWDIYRPRDIDNKYFPPSCCVKEYIDSESRLCSSSTDGLIKKGCFEGKWLPQYGERLFPAVSSFASVILTFAAHVYLFLIRMW